MYVKKLRDVLSILIADNTEQTSYSDVRGARAMLGGSIKDGGPGREISSDLSVLAI